MVELNHISIKNTDFAVTGVMVQYLFSCKRELWFFTKKIDFNKEDQNIQIGKIIHETSYKRNKKEFDLGFVKFDLIETKNRIIISEIKKSSKLLEPAKMQLLYYVYILSKITEKEVEGEIRIPKERKKLKIQLQNEEEKLIQKALREIKEISLLKRPPKAEKKIYCKNCAYYIFCWV